MKSQKWHFGWKRTFPILLYSTKFSSEIKVFLVKFPEFRKLPENLYPGLKKQQDQIITCVSDIKSGYKHLLVEALQMVGKMKKKKKVFTRQD